MAAATATATATATTTATAPACGDGDADDDTTLHDAYVPPELEKGEFVVGDPMTRLQVDLRSVVVSTSITIGTLARGIPGYGLGAVGLPPGVRPCGKTLCICPGDRCNGMVLPAAATGETERTSTAIDDFLSAAGPPIIGSGSALSMGTCREIFRTARLRQAEGVDPMEAIEELLAICVEAEEARKACCGLPASYPRAINERSSRARSNTRTRWRASCHWSECVGGLVGWWVGGEGRCVSSRAI
jgi:hypothetical protein